MTIQPALTAINTKAIQELNLKMEAQAKEIEELKAEIKMLKK